MNIVDLEKKIVKNIKETTKGLFERDEIVKLSYLALLSGESVFMLGLPGVAKSLIARRMKFVMEDEKHFEYLMNKFSTPEEIFGPISIKELENDNYIRKIEGYLPTVEIAFLDEIWKASPAIQNTLLTIINEKIFKNGTSTINVPLKLLISASNELPQEGEGLEALYDRFLIRYYVNPATTRESFEKIMNSENESDFSSSNLQKITAKEILEVRKSIKSIKTSSEVFDFINNFKNRLEVELSKKKPYISDRRWKKILNIMKTNTLISGRDEVSLNDLFVIKHCSWETDSLYKQIENIFNRTFIESITKRLGSSITEIEDMLILANDTFKKGYVNTKEHDNRKIDKYTYYKYSQSQNDTYFWIPLDKNGKINNNNHGYCNIRYYDKQHDKQFSNSLNTASTQNWYLTNLQIKKDRSILRERAYKLKPMFKGIIKKDNKKIDESSLVINNALILNSRLIDNIKNEVEQLKKIHSTFSYSLDYIFDKSEAVIIDRTKKLNQRFTELLGEIQNVKKSKEKN